MAEAIMRAEGDWSKGDEYNKKWLTNSAWNKQTKPFKWLIDKFNPPGWENYDWGEKKGKLYQNIVVDGSDLGQNPKKKNSKFWNKGKWDNFIAPLLPKDCEDQVFVEVGCNAGLFLKLAKDIGFRDVVGIEKSRSACKAGIKYRGELDYKILNRMVGGDFNFDEIPVADVTLLSTVHYYFDINHWIKYLDRLQYKTRYCLIVSRSLGREKHWRPSGEIANIRNYFKNWAEVGAITDISTKGDPHPRELWALMFRSSLVRKNVNSLYAKNEKHGTWKKDYIEMNTAKIKLAQEISQKDKIKTENTLYYKQWLKRKQSEWSKEKVCQFVQDKIDLMFDVKHNGLKEPLSIKMSGQIYDGGHRLAILKALGYKSVIVRIV